VLEWQGRSFFLYVGTDKAASTWIYDVLRAHPECYVPEVKDLYYFDQHYHRGEAWYRSWFDGVREGHRALGELSHDYLYSHAACLRIHRDAPHARIIISLREPVSRAFSNYLFLVRHGMTRLPFEDALRRFPELIEHGLYADVVRRYLRTFGEENVLILLFDEIRTDGADVTRRLFRFLGLREDLPLEGAGDKRLPAARPRNVALASAMKSVAIRLRHAGFEGVLGRLKSNAAVQKLLYREYDQYPVLDPGARGRLAPFFDRDRQDLEEVLGRSLAHWAASPAAREPHPLP
jgi:hypothetical protein